MERDMVHIHDLVLMFKTEFPESAAFARTTGIRTALAIPLIQGRICDRGNSYSPNGGSSLSEKQKN